MCSCIVYCFEGMKHKTVSCFPIPPSFSADLLALFLRLNRGVYHFQSAIEVVCGLEPGNEASVD